MRTLRPCPLTWHGLRGPFPSYLLGTSGCLHEELCQLPEDCWKGQLAWPPLCSPGRAWTSGPSFASRAIGRGAEGVGSRTHQHVRTRPGENGQRDAQEGGKELRGPGTALFSRSGIFPGAAQCPRQACDRAAPVGEGRGVHSPRSAWCCRVGPRRAGGSTGIVGSSEDRAARLPGGAAQRPRTPRESASGACGSGRCCSPETKAKFNSHGRP